ncbi:MAG: 37S ribosomal protein S16, mitochondrial [Pleopsidium flavum]|nr:MAG: 37S ribosomal protein S16, mitochondrial [Pleopsidium flavum]
MVVRIRLARFGKRNAPFYNIVVSRARTARNSKPIEVIGTYDPIPKAPPGGEGKPYKDIKLDSVRAKYWLGVGAQPSDPAWRLLSMIGLLEPKFRVGQIQKASRIMLAHPASEQPAAAFEGR